MFCPYCGNQLEDGTSKCTHCGSELSKKNEGGEKRSVPVTVPKRDSVTDKKSNSIFSYIVVGLAILECIIPFLCWVNVPVFNSISSFFGGSNSVSNYSLFGYIGASGNAGQSGWYDIMILVEVLISILQIVLNAIFVLKAIAKNKFQYRYNKIASIFLLIIAISFLLIMGISSAVFQIIKISYAPWMALIVSILDFVLVKRARLEEKNNG